MNSNPEKKEHKFSPKRFFQKIARFFRDMKGEVKKIVWPTRKQLWNNSVVVTTIMLGSGLIIWLIDLAFGGVVKLVLGI